MIQSVANSLGGGYGNIVRSTQSVGRYYPSASYSPAMSSNITQLSGHPVFRMVSGGTTWTVYDAVTQEVLDTYAEGSDTWSSNFGVVKDGATGYSYILCVNRTDKAIKILKYDPSTETLSSYVTVGSASSWANMSVVSDTPVLFVNDAGTYLYAIIGVQESSSPYNQRIYAYRKSLSSADTDGVVLAAMKTTRNVQTPSAYLTASYLYSAEAYVGAYSLKRYPADLSSSPTLLTTSSTAIYIHYATDAGLVYSDNTGLYDTINSKSWTWTPGYTPTTPEISKRTEPPYYFLSSFDKVIEAKADSTIELEDHETTGYSVGDFSIQNQWRKTNRVWGVRDGYLQSLLLRDRDVG